MNKRADLLAFALILIIIVMIILMIVDNFALKGCRSDKECGDGFYCGVDNECHEHPVVKETVIETQYDLMAPAIIVALGLITGAIILKIKKFSF